MAGNVPNIGGEATTNLVTGGIGSLLQGFLQGHQQKLENEETQQQIAMQKAALGDQVADRFRTQLKTSPQLAGNQNYLRILSNASKQYGFQLPTTAEGDIDVNAFAPKENLMASLDTPEKVQAFQALSPEGQQAAAAQYDTTDVPAGFIGTQRLPITPSEITSMEVFVRDQVGKLETGTATVAQLDDIVSSIPAQFRPFIDIDKMVESNPLLLSNLAAGTRAKIDDLVQHGVLDKAHAAAILEDANSLAGLRKIQAEHFKTMDVVSLRSLQEKIRRDDQLAAQSQRTADIAEQRISAMLRGQDIRAAVDVRGQNLGKGTDPLSIAKSDVKELRSYVQTLQARKTSLQHDENDAFNQGLDVPKELTAKMTEVSGQLDNYSSALHKAEDSLPQIEDQILRSHGVTGLTPSSEQPGGANVRATGTDAQPAYVQAVTSALAAVPKAARMAQLTSWKNWAALTGEQKKDLARAVMALP